MLVASSALSFVVSFVKIIIERSFVPQVPFEKFSTVGHGEARCVVRKRDFFSFSQLLSRFAFSAME